MGTLHLCRLPVDLLKAAVTNTKDYTRQTLSYNDTRAVMQVTFNYILTEYGNVHSCSILFRHLSKQLDLAQGGLFAGCHGKKDWIEKCDNLWKMKRRPGHELTVDQQMLDNMCDDAKAMSSMLKIRVKDEVEKERTAEVHAPGPAASPSPCGWLLTHRHALVRLSIAADEVAGKHHC